MKRNVFLVGTGQMAIDYFKVLNNLNCNLIVIGRGEESAKKFESETGLRPFTGGLLVYVSKYNLPEDSHVIIATGSEALMSALLLVLQAGAHKVLIEKPGAISIAELITNEGKIGRYSSNIFIAYNRRFFASVLEAQKMINEDEGLQSIHFEFTEWADKIEPLKKADGVKSNWFFANSTHVIDLAFYLAGKPVNFNAFSKSGKLEWHQKTNFVGAGVTDKGVLFSYLSNWESAGRWSIELLTQRRRIYLKPLESISVQEKGTVYISQIEFEKDLDFKYKPGLFLQVTEFLKEGQNTLLTIDKHIQMSKEVYSKILNN